MASGTAIARAPLSTGVGLVVEFHIESLEKSSRKSLHRRIISVEFCMTNRTKGAVLIGNLVRNELVHMATDTRFMAGVCQFPRLSLTSMAGDAIKLFMFGDVMSKRLEI